MRGQVAESDRRNKVITDAGKQPLKTDHETCNYHATRNGVSAQTSGMQQLLISTLPCSLSLAPTLSAASAASCLLFKRLSSALANNISQWQAKATKELKGRDPAEVLAHHTQDVSAGGRVGYCHLTKRT